LQVDDSEVRRAVLAELDQVQYFAQIDHPNLVSIEDKGEVSGIPYLVMSFAGTETLRDRMPQGGALPTPAERDELLRYFLQCCRGLSALHERSLVHFDIKPANVFLKGAVARLGDYGLSKLVTHSRGSLSMGRGTPYYMAPELLQRRGDHRSDVYSLGVMLYEILCGKVPFTGDSEWEVLKQHETKAPELPRHLSSLERAVLQRCLQKDPAARYQSVLDLIAAFGAQAGVGAAAWSDVRAGAAAGAVPTGSATPPPLPAVPPKPLPESGARRYAQYVAEQAVHGARQVARVATETLRDTLQELRDDGRGRPTRHRRAMARLRGRFHWPPRAPRPRRAAIHRSSGLGRALTIIGVLAVGLGMLGFVALWISPVATPFAEAPQELVIGSEPVRIADTSRSATFSRFGVPRRFTDLVSTSEPEWVALAQRDHDRASLALEQRLDQLRERVPFLPDARAEADDLPTFGGLRALPSGPQAELDVLVGQVLAGRDDDALVQRLTALGPVALASLAARLAQIRYDSRDDVERARRLHAVLQRATGCHEMPLVDEGSLVAIAHGNRHVGELWSWFLNEVAHTERTWTVYRSLRRAR
ncbi:MAG: serine/threonine protein kinase, partial [Planctomycetes bacterium]|nr:serine/threonine protein kinase [Planctomycetota bacterium]